jgi:DNA-binding transcriptional MocR family regulator
MQRQPGGWMPDLVERSGPLYLAIADALADDLTAGRIKAGERLPAQRDLAARLKIDFTTVGRAFAEARRRGLIEAAPGRGSFVRQPVNAEDFDAGSAVDMTMNLPPLPASLDLRGRIDSGLAAVLARPDFTSLLTYRDAAGAPSDRRAGTAWLAPRLPALSSDRVIVASGAQAALAAVLTTLAKPGDLILAEELTYPGLRLLAQQLGLRLQGLAMDEQGLIPAALEEACWRQATTGGRQPAALYTVPVLHSPTTATMPLERRREIAAIATRHGLKIIEDDTYGLLARQAPPPLASLAPQLTYYIGGLAKVLTPMLRVAYLVAPDTAMASRLTTALRALTGMAPPLMVALATDWITSGQAQEILTALRQESMARQRLAADLLPAELLQTQPEAHHLWLHLPKLWHRADFVSQMQRQHLALVASDAFVVGDVAPEAVRLCLGAAPDQRLLHHALSMLAMALRGQAEEMGTAAVV